MSRKIRVWYVRVNGQMVLTDGEKFMDPLTLEELGAAVAEDNRRFATDADVTGLIDSLKVRYSKTLEALAEDD